MRNLVPRFILEQYAQDENGGRFQAVSLFADISGFSGATHALARHGSEAAETMAAIMRGLFEPFVAQVHAQGGFITTFAGDALTALFPLEGAASAYLRALAAAVAIQQHVADHPVQVTAYGRFAFAVKLGLGAGEVEWGILCPARPAVRRAQQAAYFFGGPAIETAAAAERQAQPGNLVLAAEIYAQVQDQVEALSLAPGYWRWLAVKGELPAPLAPLPPGGEGAVLASDEAARPGAVDFFPADLEQETPGDFRQVVSVMIQLRGIETRQDLDIFMQAVFDLLPPLDGYLNRVDLGDKGCRLLLFWGMPISHENDVQRALDFCLELGNYTPGAFRAGLSYDLLYAGWAGAAERGEYTAYGDGVNLAARLMAGAPWEGLWLDERLAGRARKHFILETVGCQAFKGFAEPQAVYALVERRPAGESFFAGRMVGRQAEQAALDDFMRPLLAPAGESRYAGVLAVVGEAGLGKSRLVHEYLHREGGPVAGGAVQLFLGQSDPLLPQALHPFRYWLRNYFNLSPELAAERNKRSFSRKLEQLLAVVEDAALRQELERTRSCLGALVGLEWESSLYARLDAQGRYENTLQALKALLQAESRRRPVVLVLEDAQWLDEESIEFLHRLERQIAAYPLTVLLTARPERVGELLGPGHPYRQVELAGLAADELAALAVDRLGGPAAPDLLALLAARSEHNPFFAEQLLLYLREQGLLEQRDGTWQLAGAAAATSLPDEVRAIFGARLDRLARQVREVVQAAAVLGREFEVRVLAAMLQADPAAELRPTLRAAEQEMIWTELTQLRYLFKHALLRDAAYARQLQAQRRELHRLAAEALGQLYVADLPAHYGEIAYHYEAACRQGLDEVRELAVRALQGAGQAAAARYENAAALDWYGRALALTLGEAEEERLELLFEREAVYHRLGRRAEQRGDLQALAELVQARLRPEEQAELALRRARLANAVGDYDQAQLQAQAAAAAAQRAGAVGQEAAAQLEWGEALWRQGDYPAAREHVQAAVRLAQAAGRPELQGVGTRLLGNVAGDQGDYAAAQRYCEQALALAREVGDRAGEVDGFNSLGVDAFNQGDYTAAQRYYEQSLALAREIGDRRSEGLALGNRGFVAADQGDYTAAQRYYEQSLAIAREIGDQRSEGFALGNRGLVAADQGDDAAAQRYLEQALAIMREVGDQPFEGRALGCLGELALVRGDDAAAQRYYEQALAIAREIGHRLSEGRALGCLGKLASTLGDYAAAQRYLEQALAIAREIGDRRGEGFALGCLGSVALARGDDAAAQGHYEQALAIWRELGRPQEVAASLAGLAAAVLAQGHRDAARAHLREMLPILAAHPHLDGAAQPRLALLRCGRALLALGDEHGREILVSAHSRLQEVAARMEGEERRRFLEDVPENRALVAEVARMSAAPEAPVGESPAQPLAPREEEAGLPARTGKKVQKKTKKGDKGKKKGEVPEREKRGKQGKKEKRAGRGGRGKQGQKGQ